MGYLDNSTITVDAILTKRGRELLAMGRGTANGFQITQFALADDEVDYDLWNPAHPLGSAYYGTVIEHMPVTEAVPDETQSMKYKLITLPRTVSAIPYLQASKSAITVKPITESSNFLEVRTYFTGASGDDKSVNIFNKNAGYTAILLDTTYVTMIGDDTKGTSTTIINGSNQMSPATSLTAVLRNQNDPFITIKFILKDRTRDLDPTVVKTTKLIITGNETGGRVVIPVSVVNEKTVTKD